jgi:hypothetical protein
MLSATLSWKQMILCEVEHQTESYHSTKMLFSWAFGVELLVDGGLDGHLRRLNWPKPRNPVLNAFR